MTKEPAGDYWPKSLAHLAGRLVRDTDTEVVIGEITSEPNPEAGGVRMLSTALVPKRQAGKVLETPGGIGHGVRCNGPYPGVGPKGGFRPSFWVDGPGGVKFKTLINTWHQHNKTVLVPDNGLLMCYGLVPRAVQDGAIYWDDPRRPVYDVVRVTPLSEYSVDTGHTTARITIQRDYLEDFLSLTGCVAIATFFEERYSSNDPEIEELLGKSEGRSFELPGRELWIKRSTADWLGNQLSQVWGCSLLLAPAARPISDEREQKLAWPDRKAPIGIRDRDGFGLAERVFVRDEVLAAYEKRPEFDINPETGSVSHNGWWSASYCRRYGRNHIQMELRKLYESATFDVIKHFNKFAVKREIADRDRASGGTRHIGDRAKDLVYAFLQLTTTLTRLADTVGLFFTQEDMGTLATGRVNYSGWWTFPSLKPLGHVVPLSLSPADFLVRCKELFKLFENLRPAPLRDLVIKLGVAKKGIEDFGSLKLLGVICQLAKIATDKGFDLISDSAHISAQWDKTSTVKEMEPLFALNALRTAGSHLSGSTTSYKISEALAVFGVDPNQCRSGWGKALDEIYDRLASSIRDTEGLVGKSWK